MFEVFKTVCSEVNQNLSILSLKEIQQESHVNVHSIRNARRKMEDQHMFYEDINTLFGFNEVCLINYIFVFPIIQLVGVI